MEIDIQDELHRDGIIFYSVLYSSVTVVFAMAVLTKFLTNEFRFGFRSFLSLATLFLGEPLCQFLVEGPGGLVVFTAGCLFIYYILPASHLPITNQSVLITGCDRGFGHALAIKLDKIGIRVFAGCLEENGSGAIELKNNCSNKLHILQLDVTSLKDIETVSNYIKGQVGDTGLWGVVNNAGTTCYAELGMTSEPILKKIMDVNIFGPVRVTKAMLPLVKQAQGRIINVSSLLGRISLEGWGAYSMSKHALVAYTNTLRQEMKHWGVSVSIVEPMGFYTGVVQDQYLEKQKEGLWSTLDEETKQIYGREYLDDAYAQISTCSKSTFTFPRDLNPVIRCIRSGLMSKRPRERYPVGQGADILMNLYPLLPVWLSDCIAPSLNLLPRRPIPQALRK